MTSMFVKYTSLATWFAVAGFVATGCGSSAPEVGSDQASGTQESAIDGVDPVVGGDIGSTCGTLRGLTCKPGLYCDYLPADHCGNGDQAGTCVPPRTQCNDVVAPVCGCNGVTYPNACQASVAAVSVDHDGPCPITCDFQPVTDPHLADLVGVWARHTHTGIFATDETLTILADATYAILETTGPYCDPTRLCPAVPTRRLEAHGTVTIVGGAIALHPVHGSSTELITSTELQRNCEGATRLAGDERSEKFFMTPVITKPGCPIESPICQRCRETPTVPICARINCPAPPPGCF